MIKVEINEEKKTFECMGDILVVGTEMALLVTMFVGSIPTPLRRIMFDSIVDTLKSRIDLWD